MLGGDGVVISVVTRVHYRIPPAEPSKQDYVHAGVGLLIAAQVARVPSVGEFVDGREVIFVENRPPEKTDGSNTLIPEVHVKWFRDRPFEMQDQGNLKAVFSNGGLRTIVKKLEREGWKVYSAHGVFIDLIDKNAGPLRVKK